MSRRPARVLPALAGLACVLALVGCSTASPDRPESTSARATVTPSVPAATAVPAPATTVRTPPTTTAAPARTIAPAPAGSSAVRSPSAAQASIPPVSAPARAAGLRDVRTIVPDAVIDLRYATTHNFTGVRLYPTRARCLVHASMAAGLARAAAALRRSGLVLVFWDCYRPHAVQVRMYRVVPDPDWVAEPGPYSRSHEVGRSVDVTVARSSTAGSCPTVRTQGHCLLDMGTGFDDFSARAHAYATTDVSPLAQHNRADLRKAMRAGTLSVYSGEWWHFDGPGAAVHRSILDAAVS